MQADANRRVTCEDLDKRGIRLLIGPLEHLVKITNWLVRVNQERELKFRHRRASQRIYSITCQLPQEQTAPCLMANPGPRRACPGELRKALGEPPHGIFERRIGRAGRRVDDKENFAGTFGNHAARGIADRAAEGALRVREDRPSLEVPGAFPNALIALGGRTAPKRDRRTNPRAVVTSIWPAGLDRAEVSRVNHVRYSVKPFSLDDAPEQRFRRWPVFRGVHIPVAKHGAHRANCLRSGYA